MAFTMICACLTFTRDSFIVLLSEMPH